MPSINGNKLEEDSKIVLASTSVPAMEQSPQDECCQSLQHSPRSSSGYDPGSFQIIASALGPRVCEIFVCPLRVESVSPCLSSLLTEGRGGL